MYHQYITSLVEEIKPGLVLHVSPESLLKLGATYSVPEELSVKGNHFFLCRAVSANDGRWIPCYSEDGPGRVVIPAIAKIGHPKWSSNDGYFHPGQIWVASHEAIEEAARAARDMSRPRYRNRVKLHLLTGLPE